MNTPLTVVYLDAWLVAIDKPTGLLVHRSPIDRHETDTCVDRLQQQLGLRLLPAHRLDRATSGLLLFARDSATARNLSTQFENRQTHKTYLGLVRGHLPECGSIDHPLKRIEDTYDSRRGDGPQSAITHYRRLATCTLATPIDHYPESRYTLLELTPETGRQHQLRRHLKHVAHPLIGDVRYGKGNHNRAMADRLGIRRLWLHSLGLTLHHPESGESITLTAPPGNDWHGLRALPWQWEEPCRGISATALFPSAG